MWFMEISSDKSVHIAGLEMPVDIFVEKDDQCKKLGKIIIGPTYKLLLSLTVI